VTDDLYLDVHPGEGLSGGGIDLSALRFDLSYLPSNISGEIPFMEIHPVMSVGLPQQGNGIVVREAAVNYFVISCVLGS
jgi:hypothetical protein